MLASCRPPALLTACCAPCLPQYEQALDVVAEPEHERQRRAQIRKNVTQTLVSLRVHTVDDIQQIAAALAQSMVGRPRVPTPPHMPARALGSAHQGGRAAWPRS